MVSGTARRAAGSGPMITVDQHTASRMVGWPPTSRSECTRSRIFGGAVGGGGGGRAGRWAAGRWAAGRWAGGAVGRLAGRAATAVLRDRVVVTLVDPRLAIAHEALAVVFRV